MDRVRQKMTKLTGHEKADRITVRLLGNPTGLLLDDSKCK